MTERAAETAEAGIGTGARWTGLVAAGVVGVALYLVGGVRLLDVILLTLMLVVLPALAVAQAAVLDRVPFHRLSAYWSSIATLWVLGATAWLVGTRDGGLEAIGLLPLPFVPLLGWTVGLTAAGLGVMLVSRVVGRAVVIRERAILGRLLPRSPQEKRVFAVLSVAAGVGEELAFRGYAIPVLAVAVGLPWSVALTSVTFGVLHAYQGRIGMLRTGVMGVVLALGMLGSGSLVPVILAHVLVDLVGGLVLADQFME
jgi:membrane protease YdiL (CAAX protease family)